MEELLTAGETAQLLRCSLRTLDRERADGRGCPFEEGSAQHQLKRLATPMRLRRKAYASTAHESKLSPETRSPDVLE